MNSNLSLVLWIAFSGALGAISRFGLGALVQRTAKSAFPWGTIAVNILGCLLFGLIWQLGEGVGRLDRQTRIIILTGFMGSFTTFSTFAFESTQLFRGGQSAAALANIGLQTTVGLLALALGMWCGKGLQ